MSFHTPTTTKICPDCNEEYTPGGYSQKRCDRCGYQRELSYRPIKRLGVFSQCSEPGCNRLVEGSRKNRRQFCFEHGMIRWRTNARKCRRKFYQRDYKFNSKFEPSSISLPIFHSRALQKLPIDKFLKVADAILKGQARIIPPPESPYALPIEVDPATDPKPYGTAKQNAWRPEYQTVKERVI